MRRCAPLVVLVVLAPAAWAAAARAGDSPTLYVLTVGIEPRLTADGRRDPYALDAGFMRQALARAEPAYAETRSRVLAGRNATRQKVLQGLDWLARSVRAEDVAVLFFSTHGSMLDNQEFAIDLFSAARTSAPLRAREVHAALERIPGRVVVLLDTCCAAGVLPPPAFKHRACFLVACGVRESSDGQWDRPNVPHGWFVIAACEGLAGLADSNRDGVVTFDELARYVPGRATQFYRRQHAEVFTQPGCGGVVLARVDPQARPKELWTAPVVVKGRNPFGESDVPDPDGPDVIAFAKKARLDGGADDVNAAPWSRVRVPQATALDGPWESRWRGGEQPWQRGPAEVREVGDRVYILFANLYLLDVKRTGDQLAGRYINLGAPKDSTPWAGRVVSPDRIDGVWKDGRWDFRRQVTDGPKSGPP